MGECIAEDKCQTDKDFCTTGMDPNCSKSPYQEPEATLNGLGIGLIVACSAVFLATLFFFHKRAKGCVEKRFKKHFATKVIESMSVDTWNDDLDLQNFGDAFRKIDSTGSGKWQGRRIYLKRRIDGVLRCFQPWKDFREGHLMLIPAATSALTRRRNDNTCLIILYFFNKRINEIIQTILPNSASTCSCNLPEITDTDRQEELPVLGHQSQTNQRHYLLSGPTCALSKASCAAKASSIFLFKKEALNWVDDTAVPIDVF